MMIYLPIYYVMFLDNEAHESPVELPPLDLN